MTNVANLHPDNKGDGGLRVLLVENEDPGGAYIALLTRLGCDVTFVETAAAAEQAVKNTNFDACVLDIRLPDKSGFEVAEFLRDSYPTTRIIICTVFANQAADVIRALRGGVFDYVIKSVKIAQDLEAAIVRVREDIFAIEGAYKLLKAVDEVTVCHDNRDKWEGFLRRAERNKDLFNYLALSLCVLVCILASFGKASIPLVGAIAGILGVVSQGFYGTKVTEYSSLTRKAEEDLITAVRRNGNLTGRVLQIRNIGPSRERRVLLANLTRDVAGEQGMVVDATEGGDPPLLSANATKQLPSE